MPLLYHIGAVALLEPLNTVVFVCVSLLLGAVAYLVISKTYIRLLTVKYSAKKAVYTGRYIKAKSQLRALTEKELKRFFSSAVYMLNSALGLVFMVALGVFALIKRSTLVDLVNAIFAELTLSSDSLNLILIIAMLLISSMNMISLSSVSLEGKCLWIPKTMPISEKVLLKSKALAHLVVTVPPTLLSSVLLIIASGAGAEYWFFYITIPQLANVFSAFFGIIINVAFPRFDFDNEAQIIKQSMSAFVGLMSQMLLSVAVAVGFGFLMLHTSAMLATVLCFLFFIALAVASYVVLMGPTKRKFEAFNA